MSKKKNKTVEELLDEALVPEEEQPYEVLENWVWVRLKSFNDYKKRSIQPKKYPDEVFELYSVPSYSDNKPEIINGAEIGSGKQTVEPNEVLLCKINPRINRVWIVSEKNQHTQLASTEWIVINKSKMIYPRYLLFLLQSPYFRLILTSNVSGVGGSLTRAKPKEVDNHPIALPPLNEQKRITNKVERLLDKADQAKRLIEEAKETFELRRAAILDKAFCGELTEEWRKKNVNNESPENIIEKAAEISRPKKIINDPLDSNVLNNLFELPETWNWVRLNDLIESTTYGTSAKANEDESGTPVLRMGNIVDGNIMMDNLKYLPSDYVDVQKYTLEPDDLLFNRTNSYELVGKTGLVTDEIADTSTFASYLIRVRLIFKDKLANYVCQYINSHVGRNFLLSMVTQQVGQANINSKKLAALPVPIPPENELREINNILTKQTLLEEKINKSIEIENTLNLIKQSILSKAFRGELGTNDPTEESVIELLKEVLQDKQDK